MSGVWTGCGVTSTRRFSTRYDRGLVAGGLLPIAMNWCTGEVAGSTQVTRVTDLRAHPGQILIVFGAPIAFAITGFLHLVADWTLDAAIYHGRVRAQPSARPGPTSHLRPRLISSGRSPHAGRPGFVLTGVVGRSASSRYVLGESLPRRSPPGGRSDEAPGDA
jgi:hypothetical protein